jgi:hypothetical protein
MGMEISLPAAAAVRLEDAKEAGVLHVGDVFVGQAAQGVGFDGAIAQLGRKGAGGGDRRLRGKRADLCGLRIYGLSIEQKP